MTLSDFVSQQVPYRLSKSIAFKPGGFGTYDSGEAKLVFSRSEVRFERAGQSHTAPYGEWSVGEPFPIDKSKTKQVQVSLGGTEVTLPLAEPKDAQRLIQLSLDIALWIQAHKDD